MTPPIMCSNPARGAVWAGLLLLILSVGLSMLVSPGQAADRHDEPPATETLPLATPPTSEHTPTTTVSPTVPTEEIPETPQNPSPTVSPSLSPSASPERLEEPRPTDLPTPSSTPSPSPSATGTHVPPTDPVEFASGSILISEVAWAGTLASAHDEWVELYNPGGVLIDLDGWVLTDNSDLHVQLELTIPPYSFVLLERTDDTTVASIPADQIYTGSLKNSGDVLFLLDPTGKSIDTANAAGGAWPAGDATKKATMERRGGVDQPGNWATFTGYGGRGIDNDGNPVQGTPRGVNSIHLPPPLSPTPSGTLAAPSPTPTPSSTPSTHAHSAPGCILINEVAWAGTSASSSDEWLELYNPGEAAISLDGWWLKDGGDIEIALHGIIPPQGYFLLERTDDQTVSTIAADLIYSGSLANGGEVLRLSDHAGNMIDSANLQGGGWPAGDHHAHATMERRGREDQPGSWTTFTGFHGVGLDAAGKPIQGTPRQINSIFFPTPQPTWIPGKIVINEVLIRPHYDWEGAGGVDTGDEFIELLNLGPRSVNLRGWLLDDISGAGSKPYGIPSQTLAPGEFAVFFRSRTRIALNDGGDSARLLSPDGRLVDKLTYLRVRAYNLSYGRLPDGSGKLSYGLWPTPGYANLLFEEPPSNERSSVTWRCSQPSGFTLSLGRLARHPLTASLLSSTGYRLCWPRHSFALPEHTD